MIDISMGEKIAWESVVGDFDMGFVGSRKFFKELQS